MGATIVCAVDPQDERSRHPLTVAADLSQRLGLALVVAYVARAGDFSAGDPAAGAQAVPFAPTPALPYAYPVAPDAAQLDEARDQARRRVERLLVQWGLEDAHVEVALETVVADGLRRIATDRDAELLVVGSHAHGSLRAALLGSSSHALVADAPCPLVVVPASD